MTEYIVLSKPNDQPLENFLNSRAVNGWQLLQYVPGEGYIFSRDKIEEPAKPKPTRKVTRKTKSKPE